VKLKITDQRDRYGTGEFNVPLDIL